MVFTGCMVGCRWLWVDPAHLAPANVMFTQCVILSVFIPCKHTDIQMKHRPGSGSSILGVPAEVTVTEASLEKAITAIELRAKEREESLRLDIMAAVEARFTAVLTAFEERVRRSARILATPKSWPPSKGMGLDPPLYPSPLSHCSLAPLKLALGLVLLVFDTMAFPLISGDINEVYPDVPSVKT